MVLEKIGVAWFLWIFIKLITNKANANALNVTKSTPWVSKAKPIPGECESAFKSTDKVDF